jgi:hypothetical protein
MDRIDLRPVKPWWLHGIFIDGEYKVLEEPESQILGGFSLKEAEELCLISPNEEMPVYCEDTGEKID